MRSEVRGLRSEVGAVLAAMVLAGCGTTSPCGVTSGTVTNIVDGDTVDLDDGDRIRLLSVDTPETTSGKNDCYGQEAKAFTTNFVLNKKVTVTYDAECKDRYGRSLAYVAVNGTELNRELVAGGYACEYTLPPSGEKRSSEFEELESTAKTNRTGMWGACSTITCGN
jgi:micrococcal nuclease